MEQQPKTAETFAAALEAAGRPVSAAGLVRARETLAAAAMRREGTRPQREALKAELRASAA